MCLNLDDERSRLIPFDDEGFFRNVRANVLRRIALPWVLCNEVHSASNRGQHMKIERIETGARMSVLYPQLTPVQNRALGFLWY